MHYVYFIKSVRNKKIYTGLTDDLPTARLRQHNYGSNKWTRENGPFTLLYYESYQCKKDAASREKFYKMGFGRIVRDAILAAASAKGGPASGGG